MSPNITSRSTSGDLASLPCLDLEAIRSRSKATWSAGDFAVIGSTLQIVAESLCEAADVRPGQDVLDVATGNGATALAAARRYADVVGVDFVPALLDSAHRRAEADGFPIDFREGDAQALRFEDESFDRVLSTFGVMFAPDHAMAASEMARACRPGGRIGLANWTPGGFIGQLFKTLGRHVPPPPGVQPPALWGVEAHLQSLFGPKAASIVTTTKHFTFRYRSPAHFIDVFRTWYGPVHKAFASLPADKSEALERDLMELLNGMNRGGTRSLVVPGEYLEIVITRR